MSKRMDVYLELYARFCEEVGYYHKKVVSWLEKYSYIQEDVSKKGYSYYSPVDNMVYFSEDRTGFVEGHEYGHSFWHSITDPRINCDEFREITALLFDEEEEEKKKFLNNYGKTDNIIPLTDFISAWYTIPRGFKGHNRSYWQTVGSYGVENEVFASLFGYIYTQNFVALEIFKKNFPKFYDSCLALIDKGVYKAHNN